MENLKYNIEKKPNCVLLLNVEVAAERIAGEYKKVYEKIRRGIKIPGFRKGNVPVNIIKERYAEEAKAELINNMAPDVLSEVFREEKINPVTTPKITDIKFDDDQLFSFEVEVEVYPEVRPRKYKKIKLQKKEYTVGEEDIEKTIDSLREKNAVLQVKEGPVSDGDFAIVNIKTYMEDKETDIGLPRETIIQMDGNSMLPGFEEKIKGLEKGQSKEFDYEFPEDFAREDLKGKAAKFKVDIKEIKEKKLPSKKEIVDSMGLESEAKLDENVRNNLKQQMERLSDNELEDDIIGYLVEKHDFEIPEGLVKENIEKKKKQMAEYVKQQGGDPDQMDETKIKEKVISEIKAGIILSSIAREEEIDVTDEDRKSEEEKISNLLGVTDAKEIKKYINDNIILTNKVMTFIKDNAKIKNVAVKK